MLRPLLLPCALLALLFIPSFGRPPASASATEAVRTITFGSEWLENAPTAEVTGFLNGYYDCLPNPRLRSLPGWSLPMKTLVQAISGYYQRNPHSTLNAAQVALRVAARLPGRSPGPGGEVYKGRHGFFDGQWWHESIAPEQLGYVEGYLLCLGRLTSVSQARKLATAITAWYKAHPSRETRSIASVLADQLKSRLKERSAP